VLDPASGIGGATTGGAAEPAGDVQGCIVVAPDGVTAGSAAGGTNTAQTPNGNVIVNGEVVTCSDVAPDTASSAEAGVTTDDAASTGQATGQSFTCVVADASKPGTLTCTLQP
jgi:hypothetical protein